MFEEAKIFALLQKHQAVDASVAPAGDVIALARGERSKLIAGAAIAEGAAADFLLLDLQVPEMAAGDLDARLVYGAPSEAVDTAVVAGSVVMRGREVPGADEALAEVRERSQRLTS
jgi:5-methylthioadenosine/S-adenosylhomocysteine deaminase